MARANYYNFRQAKRDWKRRQKPSPMDAVLKVIENTPGAWAKIFDFQKQAYLNMEKEESSNDELAGREESRIDEEELARYFLRVLSGSGQ